MKQTILVLVLVATVLPFLANAQKERNIWCFGDGAELDFNGAVPVNRSGCVINTIEGCASIADRHTGQLLFYTDGSTVYDRTNKKMPGNIIPLGGNSSTTQSALIVPVPLSATLYYIFCTDAQVGNLDVNNSGDSGTQYCIIDMSLNGGLGDIVQQPVRLLTPTCEKIAATFMAGGQGYWVILHQWNPNSFFAYPVTGTGIGAPVISATGVACTDNSVYDPHVAAIGYMRVASDGGKIAMAVGGDGKTIQVFNFNNSTGIVSAPVFTDNLTSRGGPYGICFSPNGQLLYHTVDGEAGVYQYNLAAGNASAIKASHIMVGAPVIGGALQTGPDNRIYVAVYGYPRLDRINYPDNIGPACGYDSNAVTLTTGGCLDGLPEFSPTLSCQAAPIHISADNLRICSGDSTPVCAAGGYAGYQWNGGSTDSCVQAKSAGSYYVTATDPDGCTVESNHVAISTYQTPSVTVTVQGDTLTAFNAVSYQWYFNNEPIADANSEIYIATQAGSYTVAVTDTNGCSAKSSAILITGIDDLETGQFIIYPNPSAGTWQLAVDSKLMGSKLEVFDNNGRVVFNSKPETQNSKLELEVPSGVYYLRISSPEYTIVRKLVKL